MPMLAGSMSLIRRRHAYLRVEALIHAVEHHSVDERIGKADPLDFPAKAFLEDGLLRNVHGLEGLRVHDEVGGVGKQHELSTTSILEQQYVFAV